MEKCFLSDYNASISLAKMGTNPNHDEINMRISHAKLSVKLNFLTLVKTFIIERFIKIFLIFDESFN